MTCPRAVIRMVLWLAGPVLMAHGATATTLVRQGLDRLAAENDVVVDGMVLDTHSYWNDQHSFIFTDVRIRPTRAIKGGSGAGDLTFTVMGGTVGDVTILVVGGPELVPGSEYVLFLKHLDLPGAPGRLTVRDLGQGVFDVKGGRAVSQAIGELLLPDAEGRTDVAGGEGGVPLEDLIRRVRDALDQGAGTGREP